MGIKFGTDGWRGIIADDFTFANVGKVAQAIADYLIENKIKEQRLTVKGYGDKYPLGFVTTEEEKQKNNRIEFQVTSLTKTKK